MADSTGRIAGARFVAVLLAAALAAAAPPDAAAQDAPEPNSVYEFDQYLAPVCIDGEYPLSLELSGGDVEGTLVATTSPKGKVTGTFTAGETVLVATGRVRYEDGVASLKLTMKAKGERVRLTSTALEPAGFTGDCVGKGTLAPGTDNTFTLWLGDAEPAVAHVVVVIPPGTRTSLSGTGTVQVCGAPVSVKASRRIRPGRDVRLLVRGGGFRWSGIGPPESVPGEATVAWTAQGWGAKVSGAGFALETTPPPSGIVYADPAPLYEAEEVAPPDAPVVGGGPVVSWSVDPALPEGLTFDPETGVIAGLPPSPAPEGDYTVTASNLAGSASTVVSITVRGNRAYSFDPEQRALTEDDFRHFLVRTHFGVNQDELAALQAAGLPAYLDDVLEFPSGTAVEAAAFPELVNADDPPGLEGGFPGGTQISRWWTRIMIETDRPLQEAMAFFWHDHMPVAWDVFGGGTTHFEVDYINLLRHQGSGNLRDFLLAVAKNSAMLVYLDGVQNTRSAPNENFAREFWELFTLGVDNGYTQEDIVEAAKAFTGFRYRYNVAEQRYYTEFDPNRHHTGSKTFFGATIPGQNATDDFASVVDITLQNRPVAEFLAKKIFEYFAYESPPQALVDAMAASLRAGNWELKPFLKSLFTSEAFLSKRARQARVKSALEYAVGLVRSTGLRVTTAGQDVYHNILGQRPGLPPTVNGWPLGTLWYSAASMVNRTNFAYYVVADTARQRSVGIEVADILPPLPERTAPAVLDTLEDLLRVDLNATEEAKLLDYLNTVRQSDGTIVPSPFDGSNQAHLDERVRGLIYILAQHPTFQVK